MLRISLLATAILFFIQSHAQFSISGTVSDSLENPIPGVTVRIKNTFIGTSSDRYGHYSLSGPEGEFTIIASAVGYKTHTQSFEPFTEESSEITVDITLIPSIERLDEVMISATRVAENAPVAHTNVDYQDIEGNNLGQDLPFLLQNQISMVTTSDAGAGIGYTGFRLRGSDATRINVTVNGIPINDPESQGVFWVNMPDFASSTDNIQIQRGVGSSTNGAGAFGGTVNLQTNGLRDEAYGEVSTSYGSFNSQKVTVKAGTGLLNDHWTIDARGSMIQSDGYIDRAYSDLKSYYVSAAYYAKKSVVKAVHFAGREKTYQSWWGTPESRIDGDEEAMLAHAGNNWLDSAQTANLLNSGRTYNYYEYDNETDNYGQDHYQLHLSHEFNAKLKANLAGHYTYGSGYYEQYRAYDDFADYGMNDLIIGGDTITSTDLIRRRWLDNHFYGFTYSLKYESEKLGINWGGGLNQYDGDHFGEIIWIQYANTSNIRDRYYDNTGVKTDFNSFIKVDYAVNQKLTAFGDFQIRTVGYKVDGIDNDLRALTTDTNYVFFNPKAGVNYQVNDDIRTYASVSIANREPVRNDFIDNPSNAQPAHEQMTDYELGFEWSKKGNQFLANLYYMDYKNQLVVTGALNDVGSAIRTNVESSYRSGIELAGKYALHDKLGATFNATLSQNKIAQFTEVMYDYTNGYEVVEIEHTNTDIALSPNSIAAVGLEYLPLNAMVLTAQYKHVGKQYLDNTSDDSRAIDAYGTLDMRLSYSIFPKNLEELTINVLVNNVLNSLYSSNGYTYSYGYDGVITENFYYPQAGTNFLAGITAKF